MANKIVREIIHAKGIDIGIYTKIFSILRISPWCKGSITTPLFR